MPHSSSTYGSGDPETLNLLQNTKIQGHWLNLGAGDGRYNNELLTQANQVTAVDINQTALNKLNDNTPSELRPKLKTITADITTPLPFNTATFDSVFCTGTLHLFPKAISHQIITEINRLLKTNGIIILDFATNIKRTLPNGSQYLIPGEITMDYTEAEEFLKQEFCNYNLEFQSGTVPPEKITINSLTYTFSCQFVLLKGIKH